MAADIRAYWQQNKDASPEERLFRRLADDKDRYHWLEVAKTIVQHGETLREKRNPSVADVMARRVVQLSTLGKKYSRDDPDRLREACQIGLVLAEWDAQAALPYLRTLTARCREAMKSPHDWSQLYDYSVIPHLVTARLKAGDTHAAAEYANWLRATPLKAFNTMSEDYLVPLWRFPDNPDIAAATTWFASNPASPWRQPIEGNEWQYFFQQTLLTPLIGAPAFRTSVLALLRDTRQAGTVRVTAGGWVVVKPMKGGGWVTRNRLLVNDVAMKVNENVPIRTCDLIAYYLGFVEGLPRCELYWPQARRDAAMVACIERLQRYGDRYRYGLPRAPWTTAKPDEAAISFPLLDHPATPEDVAAGRAIFSLAGEGEVRRVEMPLPAKARWTTLKAYPYDAVSLDPRTNREVHATAYLQDGTIWQAEEVFKDGKWQRYYGFVGRYDIARVPAEEIELEGSAHPGSTPLLLARLIR